MALDNHAPESYGEQRLRINTAVTTLLSDVNVALAPNIVLDCGDVLGACLTDPSTSQLVLQWSGQLIKPQEIIQCLRGRCERGKGEGGHQLWRGSYLVDYMLTGLSSFILRFLGSCEVVDSQHLLLMSGLLEIRPISVDEVLTALKLDHTQLLMALQERGIRMIPLLSEYDDPHRRALLEHFMAWSIRQYSNPPRFVDIFEDNDLRLNEMLCWLDMECEEANPTPPFRRGDIALFQYDHIQDLCILDMGYRWYSLTYRVAGEAIAKNDNMRRLFRCRRAGC